MEIQGENYSVIYDNSTATITCSGTLRLYGKDGYQPIVDLLDQVADEKPEMITLDLRDLQFLNSAGINTFSKFVIRVRNDQVSGISVKGSAQFPWQAKSLKNLQRLMPSLSLEIS